MYIKNAFIDGQIQKKHVYSHLNTHFVDVHLRLRIYCSTHSEIEIGATKNNCGILEHDILTYALARTNWYQYEMLLSEQQKHVTRNGKQLVNWQHKHHAVIAN